MPDRVSLRQLCAAAACALLLPCAVLLSRGSWLWLALGAAPALIYYYIIGRHAPMELPAAARLAYGKFAPVLLGLHAVSMLLLAAYVSAQVSVLFPETAGYAWVGLGVLALAGFAAQKGLSAALRCGAVLLAPVAAILGAVPLLAVSNVKTAWLPPPAQPLDGLGSFTVLLLPGLCAYFVPALREKNAVPWRWSGVLALGMTAAALVNAACLSPALARQPGSFFTLARSVSVFGVMLRLESLVSGALTACAFLGMALLLCAARAAFAAAIPARTVPVWLLALPVAGCSLLPDGILRLFALVTGIFCAGFPVLTQSLVGWNKLEKKSRFLEKNA